MKTGQLATVDIVTGYGRFVYVYRYDGSGRLIQENYSQYASSGAVEVITVTATAYDDKGRIAQIVLSQDFGGTGTFTIATSDVRSYDSKGRLVLHTEQFFSSGVLEATVVTAVTYTKTTKTTTTYRDGDGDGIFESSSVETTPL